MANRKLPNGQLSESPRAVRRRENLDLERSRRYVSNGDEDTSDMQEISAAPVATDHPLAAWVPVERRRGVWDDRAKRIFLEHFRTFGVQHLAAEAAGVSARTVRTHLKEDKAFLEEYEEAEGAFADALEAAAWQRATQGTLEPIIGGKDRDIVVTHVRKYSDRLLEVLLRAKRPEKFRENVKIEADVNHKGGVLFIPALPGGHGVGGSLDDWEAAATSQQAKKLLVTDSSSNSGLLAAPLGSADGAIEGAAKEVAR